jgi:hypothetical protein
MSDPASIDSTLRALARQAFRARFHLRGRDAATVERAVPRTVVNRPDATAEVTATA